MNRKIYFLFLPTLIVAINIFSTSSSTQEHAFSQKNSKRIKKKREKINSQPLDFQNSTFTFDNTIPQNIVSTSLSSSQNTFHTASPFNQTNEQEMLDTLLTTIEFSQTGLTTFFKQTFNNPRYKELLPYSFSHFVQFMRYGKETQQPIAYYERIIRLFNQKGKVCSFITSYAFERMLTRTTPLCITLFQQNPTPLWKKIKNKLHETFIEKFSLLKSEPMDFFELLANDITNQYQEHSSLDKCKNLFMRFLSTHLDKLLWTAHDQKETWNSFKTIGEHLVFLHEKQVIEEIQDLNELCHSLVERYCYFLELSGTALEPSVLDAIKQDLTKGTITWLFIKELEDSLKTKTERLLNALFATELKIKAHGQEFLYT